MRPTVLSVVLTSAVSILLTAPDTAAVRVWQGSTTIPTYAEGPANPNAPFDLFTSGRINYPYPIRDALTDRREDVTWRSLHLENEYLRLTVLPDLGGRIYSCVDKRTGRDMFYANTAIKKALIGYRGAWAAFGVEFNFPVSHNWVSMSPVDFATVRHPDGSGSIWVGNVDQVYGSHWRVELRLHPGRTILDQKVELYNAGDVRHRYYWWSNAAVQAWDDSRLIYPTELMATHGFTSVEPWPIDRQGRDLSVIRNQTAGPVSLFTHQTREGFVGVYHPRTKSGTVHVADPAELPTHKVWSWGNDRDAAAWRTALSDDDSAYVELQAGLFRNQETYAFLEPQESVRFTESWLPVRDLGGITRANTDAVLFIERTTPTRARLALDVTRDMPGAHVRVRFGDTATTALDTTLSLSPRAVWRTDAIDVTSAPVTFELTDAGGQVVLTHTEKTFALTPAAQVRLGAQAAGRLSRSTVGSGADVVERGLIDELEGRRLPALARYRAGLAQHPGSFALLKAAGRLAVALGWPQASSTLDTTTAVGTDAIEWLQAAHARNTTDPEVEYYLGLAMAAARRPEARVHLESAQRFRATGVAASLQLAHLAAEGGDYAKALRHVEHGIAESPRASRIGALEVFLLRALGRKSDARHRARHWQSIDPTSSLIRYELTILGDEDADLWLHLGADANRVLDLADHYLSIGAHGDALRLLEREYPGVESPMREVGAVPPDQSPLVAYYSGFARGRLGDALRNYRDARSLPTSYVFPNRRTDYRVLHSALQSDPNDPTATFLLGSRYLASGLTEAAIDAWRRVRHLKPSIPTLHRNLALALLHGGRRDSEARAVLEESTRVDAANVDVYLALDGVLSAAGAPSQDRVAALRRFPAAEAMPSALVFKLAVALAEEGDDAAAERLFHDRFFPREEGGTHVRTVYAQAQLISASRSAERGDCPAALEVLDSFSRERRDLTFTAGGLADTLGPPIMARQVAAIESKCGRAAAARIRWERLTGALTTGGAPLAVAIADEARRRLGRTRTAAHRVRLEAALDAATRTLESGGTSSPGLLEYARSALYAALGRDEESRRSLTRVFLLPDRGLSHAVARSASHGEIR
jgi:tetratricopeptide (TPR) repeat protein